MKIDFKTVLVDLDDQPILTNEQGEELTLETVCISSLIMLPPEATSKLGGVEKARLFDLAHRIKTHPSGDFSIEDVAKLKENIGALYSPLVVGRAYQLLDPR